MVARPAFANRHLNPYNARLYAPMAELGVEVREYRVLSCVGRAADLVHVHWPESTFNHGLAGALWTTEALLGALDLFRARGAKVVWTAHNLEAHERRHPGPEARFWRRFIRRLDGLLALGEGSLERARAHRPELDRLPAFVTPHPHYRGEFPDRYSRTEARRQLELPATGPVLGFFGQIKAYKNVPALISTVGGQYELTLLVAGKPRDAAMALEVKRAAEGFDNVRLHLRHLGSEEMQLWLRAVDLVVLPYRSILNSGSALLALSFDRPVWLPAGGLAEELQSAVPAPWVQSGALGADALHRALEATRVLPERSEGEHLSAFAPEAVALRTAHAYRRIVEGSP
ncbi:MAG: glycosyltransferase [Myxococcota bacterium]